MDFFCGIFVSLRFFWLQLIGGVLYFLCHILEVSFCDLFTFFIEPGADVQFHDYTIEAEWSYYRERMIPKGSHFQYEKITFLTYTPFFVGAPTHKVYIGAKVWCTPLKSIMLTQNREMGYLFYQ